jgi:mevalonate kinase
MVLKMEKWKFYEGHGNGKLILFGEHFVNFSKKGIVIPVEKGIKVFVRKKADKKDLIGKENKGWDNEKTRAAIAYLKEKLGISKGIEIRIKENMPIKAGFGSSAAFCVGLIKAVSKMENLNLKLNEINDLAYNMERFYHGNPSGIDNTASVYKRAFLFKKGEKPVFLNYKTELSFAIAVLERQGNTKELVERFYKFSEENKDAFEEMLNAYDNILSLALYGLSNNKKEIIGKAMCLNHLLLKLANLSNKSVEKLFNMSLKNGCFGCKISGAGRGGAFLALCKNIREANRMVNNIKNNFKNSKELLDCFALKVKNGSVK